MNTESIKIEIAHSSQFERIASLVNDAYRGLSGIHGWTHEAELLAGPRVDALALSAMASKLTILVAILDNAVVGCVSVEVIGAKNGICRCLLSIHPYKRLALARQ